MVSRSRSRALSIAGQSPAGHSARSMASPSSSAHSSGAVTRMGRWKWLENISTEVPSM